MNCDKSGKSGAPRALHTKSSMIPAECCFFHCFGHVKWIKWISRGHVTTFMHLHAFDMSFSLDSVQGFNNGLSSTIAGLVEVHAFKGVWNQVSEGESGLEQRRGANGPMQFSGRDVAASAACFSGYCNATQVEANLSAMNVTAAPSIPETGVQRNR